MNREIKFRAWNYKEIIYNVSIRNSLIQNHKDKFNYIENSNYKIMQFTGLKDKNKQNKNCIYEGDIISLDGFLIGNIYENKEMVGTESNLIIQGFGTRTWRDTEKKAMDRGCTYSE